MNILYLANELNYTCGVTAHLLNLAKGFEGKGNNIFIICGGGNGIKKFNEVETDITVNKVFLHKNRSHISYAKAVLNLVRFVKRNKIDIIHSHTHYAANIAFSASKYCDVKTIQTNHGLLNIKGRLPHFKADKYIAINEHIYDFLINKKIAGKDDVYFIRGGIHIPITPAWKAKIKPKILASSRFVKEKGLDVFIKAVSMLPEHDRNEAEFMISGEGELEESLKQLNKESDAGIKFLGRVNDMPSLLRETHVFVFASTWETEGFPTALTEAAAYNNLVISSSSESTEKVMISDIDGLVFKTGDTYDLMIKLKLAIENYETLKPMAENFYNKVKKMYDMNTMIQKHTELYNSCLKSS